ncbi:LuxR C-terminal-related transcriptional regulator [Oerskovia enterophila]|uniref:helix-turn-helix transcriptional regulator n=1 Tax=Oerskovia enterophila TaxID=43678 RepID=UPI00339A4EBB
MSITERVAPEPPRVEDEVVLSRRELVVLANLSEDVTLEQVAARLFVTRNTVKSQLRSIYRKLGVSTRSEAVAWARANGVSDR